MLGMMTQTELEPKAISPARFLDSTSRNVWIALGVLIASITIIAIAALYATPGVEAGRAEQITLPALSTVTPVKKTVLVLFPQQIDLPVNVIAAQAIREEFAGVTDLKLDVYYEYMDLNRFPDPAYQQQLFDLYAVKYKSKPVDLVIVVSEIMLNLWLAHRAEIFPNAPIVFFDITTERIDTLKMPSDVTGVSGVEDQTKSVQWILDKLPTVNELVVVHGVGQADQEFIQPVLTLQEKMKGHINFTNLSTLPLSEIKQRIAKLPKTSIVLYNLMFEDVDGNRYRPIDVLRELTAVSAVPVISGYDVFIGTGSIGGYMYSIDHQARDAAQTGLRILRGEAPSAIPIVKNQSNQFIFDQLALQRFGIPLSALPPDSIVKNQQYSIWELYQPQIITVIVVFVGLLLLVTYFIIVTRRLNSARLSLNHLNIDLETRVQERTIALSQTNHELELGITNLKLVEDALRESEMLFHFLTDTAPVLIWQSGTDALCDYFNQRWLDFTGRTLDQELGNGWLEGIHPDDYQNCLDIYMEAFAAQREFKMEYRLRRADGEYCLLMDNGVPRLTPDGRFLGYLGTCIDISDRKQAEEALRESEKRFRSMFELHAAVMLLIDPARGQILDANNSAEKFYGYPLKQLCSMNISDINILSPEEILAERQRAVAKETNYFNFQHRVANGNIRRVEVYSSPLTVKGKTILFSLIHDVTERKLAEEKVLQLNAELEQLAGTDGLTGINNHRFLLKLAEREFDIAMRYQPPLSMIFFDIDNFKQINDTFGHATGDEALKMTIQTVCAILRSADLIGRYGGDEFVILLPQTSTEEALPLAERIHASIAAMRLNTDRGALTLTISIGIAQSLHGATQIDSVESLLHRADLALYAAKQAGKNCTMIFNAEAMETI